LALVSRIAKNFQDYFVNVIAQRVGARLCEMSVSHSLSLPYAIFEDQRSGEIL
jgi:ATP-binding cassette subfamily B protein